MHWALFLSFLHFYFGLHFGKMRMGWTENKVKIFFPKNVTPKIKFKTTNICILNFFIICIFLWYFIIFWLLKNFKVKNENLTTKTNFIFIFILDHFKIIWIIRTKWVVPKYEVIVTQYIIRSVVVEANPKSKSTIKEFIVNVISFLQINLIYHSSWLATIRMNVMHNLFGNYKSKILLEVPLLGRKLLSMRLTKLSKRMWMWLTKVIIL